MKRIMPIIILLAAVGGGYWWYSRRPVAASAEPTALVGSGSIEAETVAITAELGGRILDINVDEGEEVEAGQVLVELDRAELLAQESQLEAAVSTAKANLALVSAPTRPEEVAAAQAQLAQARVNRDGAKLTWDTAQKLVKDPHELTARINRAEAQVTEAESRLELAQVNLKRAEIQAEAASRNQSSHAALVENEAAQKRLQAAQVGVEIAEVALDGSQRQVEHLVGIRNRPLTLIAQADAAQAAYHQAEARVLAAEANLNAVKAGPAPEDIAVAQTQLLEAQTALDAIAVQVAKQTLTAPRPGLIGQKLVNPGELAAPGTVLLQLNDIDTVDLIVYIAETRIGDVQIGHKALVFVDAYERETFEGRVSFIAQEAEFTPRNIQTQEERVNLVFAVKIKLDNADHKLKPGMPADAEILSEFYTEDSEPPLSEVSPTAASQPTPTPSPLPTGTLVQDASLTPPTATPATQIEVLAWGLYVRSGPGIDHEVVGSLARGDVVTVIDMDQRTGWLQIRLPDGEMTGWITASPSYVSIRKK
ncbi:MAG TPA: efflux RND transporter periplasmic adaptor subunit [Anaerolineae bacterium]|jgi:multidrug resistance efflux pump